jgi:hypothetical protein
MSRFALKSLAVAALTLPLITQAATTFSFDTNGAAAGGVVSAAAFDQAVGNALAVGGGNLAASSGATRLLYQANLNTVNDINGNAIYLNGSNGVYFTFVVGFGEQATSVTTDTGAHTTTANFVANPAVPSFFNIYANTTGAGNNLTGLGFTAGTKIMTGTILTDGFSSSFTENLTAANTRTATANLDQSADGNQYPGVTTVVGSGATSLRVQITSWDASYFPDFSAAVLNFSSINTTQKTPFSEVNPSGAFSSNGVANGDTAANIGTQNGISGPNFIFQADANSSFSRTVPEPGSLALAGLSLTGLALFTRRRRQG